MRGELLGDIQAWLIAVLVYPGLLFGIGVALGVSWVVEVVKPRLAPIVFRIPTRPAHLLHPLYSFMRLAGRREPGSLTRSSALSPQHSVLSPLAALAGAAAPILALALIPLGGNPAAGVGSIGDVLLVLLVLALQPLFRSLARLYVGGLSSLDGARALGRFISGAVPTLVAVAALVEVSGRDSLGLVQLGAAPETGGQFFVRLVAGIALLAALPWWVDSDTSDETAGSLAGRHLQRVALAALWVALVLPRPGDLGWSIVVSVLGTVLATLAVHLVPVLWTPFRSEREVARAVWTRGLPLAIFALLLSLWAAA